MNLEEAMRRDYSAAKMAWLLVLVVQGGALVLSLAAIWSKQTVYTTFVWLVVAPVVCALLRKFAGDSYGRAEERRRALVRVDGWGEALDPAEALLLSSETTGAPSWDPPPIGTYYSSPRPPGPGRVAHIVEQSAFFTARHSRATAALCWFLVLAGASIAFTLLWIASQTSDFDAKEVGQVAASLLAFAVAGDFLALAFAYQDLSVVARRTVEACSRLLTREPVRAPDLAAVMGTYDAVLARSPPIPGIVYRAQRARLEADWHRFEVTPAGSTRP